MPRASQRRAGPARHARVAPGGTSCPAHALDPRDRPDGADEHRGRLAVRAADDVEAVVQPVDEVDVGPAGGPNMMLVRVVRPARA